MTYNPNKPRIIIERTINGAYNVVEVVRGKSGRILGSFMSKEHAEHFKRTRRA